MIVWKLDEVLRRKGVKGRDLARRMDIGENYLSRVRHEVPDRLSLMLLDALCRELECELTDLLEYRPGEQPAPVAPVKAPEPAPPARKPPAVRVKARPAPPPPPPPAAVPEPSGASVRTSALQAKLNRLKQRRP